MSDIFTMHNEHSYAAFVGVLSNIYMKAHASAPFREGPYDAKIFCSDAMNTPYRGQPDSSVERLKAVARLMAEPYGGISLQFHIGNSCNIVGKIGLKHSISQAWPMRGHAKSRHISVNLPPKRISKGPNSVRYFEWDGGDVYIDYDTPVKKVMDVLSHSKVHVCYQGGTAWLSVSMGIPTIIVHNADFKMRAPHNLKKRLFGQSLGQFNMLEGDKIVAVRSHPCERHIMAHQIDSVLRDY